MTYPTPFAISLLALAYVALVVTVRWQMMALPLRNAIEARLKLASAEAERLSKDAGTAAIAAAIQQLVKDAREENDKRSFGEIVFWSRGRETAEWQLVDKAESLITATWTASQLRGRLHAATALLQQLNEPAAVALSHRIDERLKLLEHERLKSLESKAAVGELSELYHEIMRFQQRRLVASDMESDYYNNKILWHTVVSLVAIVFVANVGPSASSKVVPALFGAGMDEETIRGAFLLCLLAGAVGGILSRLTRVLGAGSSLQSVSWIAMFLSAPVGALAAWAGSVLFLSAHALNLVLPNVQPPQLWLLLVSAAILFGFSERFFVQLAEKMETTVVGAGEELGPSLSPLTSTAPVHETPGQAGKG